MKRILCACLLICLLIPTALASEAGMVYDLLVGDGAGYGETALGDAVADAMAEQTGADVAILPAGALHGNLRGGQVTREEICRAVDGSLLLATAEVTPEQLYLLLEAGLERLTVDEREQLDVQASDSELFPQISGFDLWIDASAPVGERVYELRVNGGVLKREDGGSLTVCTAQSLLERIGISGESLETSPAAVLEAYVAGGHLEDAVTQGRIRLLGTLDDNLMDGIPLLVVVIVFAVMIVFAIAFVRHNGRPASKRYGTR